MYDGTQHSSNWQKRRKWNASAELPAKGRREKKRKAAAFAKVYSARQQEKLWEDRIPIWHYLLNILLIILLLGMVLTALLEYIDYVGSLEQPEAKAGQPAVFETVSEIVASTAMAPKATVAAALGSEEEVKNDIAKAFAAMEDSAYSALGEIPLIETGFLSNEAERDKLVTAEYQEQIAQGITQGVSCYSEPKTMYLTFDDGPFRENTLQVLSVLRERKIKGTFFLVGEYVEKNPDIARQIVEEGHTIGIHCYRHDYHELYASVDSYLADFEKARQIIFEVTGVETRMFRFPGGSKNDFNRETGDEIIQAMTERGYIYYDWNASLEDAVKDPRPEQLIANALDTALGRKKVILLAHDVVKTTGDCLGELLDHFPEYRMLPLTEDVEPIQF